MSAPDRSPKLVVAALILAEDGQRLLISKRRPDQSLPNKWEFPGGKVEPGEAPTVALARELWEELGARALVGRIWDVMYHAYPDYDVVMLVYACRLAAGSTAACREVAELAWVRPDQLASYDLLPADRPLIDRLKSDGLPHALALAI